jgi:hypothetical protein
MERKKTKLLIITISYFNTSYLLSTEVCTFLVSDISNNICLLYEYLAFDKTYILTFIYRAEQFVTSRGKEEWKKIFFYFLIHSRDEKYSSCSISQKNVIGTKTQLSKETQ